MIRFALILCALPVQAETVFATRTIPPQTIIAATDLDLRDDVIPGAARATDELIGMEARVALYAGRPISPTDVGFPAVIERNQIIPLIYDAGVIQITTEGRSLERAEPGEVIRVMNLSSRTTVSARAGLDGSAYVSQ